MCVVQIAGNCNQTKHLTHPYLPGNSLSSLTYLLLILSSLLLSTPYFSNTFPFYFCIKSNIVHKQKNQTSRSPSFPLHSTSHGCLSPPRPISYPLSPLPLSLQQSGKRSNILCPLQELRINLFHSCLAAITHQRKKELLTDTHLTVSCFGSTVKGTTRLTGDYRQKFRDRS